MAKILEGYPETAQGILIDDQSLQVDSVVQLQNPRLKAYDVNGFRDLEEYCNLMEIETQNPFHPLKIKEDLRSKHQDIYMLETLIMDYELPDKIKTTMQDLVNDLYVRMFEASDNEYKPEMDWVNAVTKNITKLAYDLNHGHIREEEIEKASRQIFGDGNIENAIPNSHCEKTIKEFLLEAKKAALINDLRDQCTLYRTELMDRLLAQSSRKKNEDGFYVTDQLKIMDQLLNSLHEPKDWDHTLKNFTQLLEENKQLFEQVPRGYSFFESIRSKLAKVPFLGNPFRSDLENISDKLKKTYQERLSFYRSESKDASEAKDHQPTETKQSRF